MKQNAQVGTDFTACESRDYLAIYPEMHQNQ